LLHRLSPAAVHVHDVADALKQRTLGPGDLSQLFFGRQLYLGRRYLLARELEEGGA
jgi:hypothetical protein